MVLRSLPLSSHSGLVTIEVQCQASFASNIVGKVHGKAIGVVELEDHVTRDRLIINRLQRLL